MDHDEGRVGGRDRGEHRLDGCGDLMCPSGRTREGEGCQPGAQDTGLDEARRGDVGGAGDGHQPDEQGHAHEALSPVVASDHKTKGGGGSKKLDRETIEKIRDLRLRDRSGMAPRERL